MPDQIAQYYDYLKNNGADVAPSLESFQKTLSDEKSAKQYYDYLRNNKFDTPDTFDSFVNTFGLKKKESTNLSSSSGQLPSVFQEGEKMATGASLGQISPKQVATTKPVKSDNILDFGEPVYAEAKPQMVKPSSTDYNLAVDKTLAKTGITPTSPNYKKEKENLFSKIRSGDLVGEGKDKLLRGEGFGESLVNTLKSSINATKDAYTINSINNPEQLAKYFNDNPMPEPTGKPSGTAGALGELIGGVIKPAALMAIPVAGQSAMVGESYYTSMANQKRALYERGLQEGLTPVESAKKAMQTAPISALTDAAMAYAITSHGGVGSQVSKAADEGLKTALTNSVKSIGKMGVGGGISEGARSGIEAASGYNIKPAEALEKMWEGATDWAKMDAGFKILGMAGLIPKYLLSAAKEYVSNLPKEVVDAHIKDMGEQGAPIAEQINNYQQARSKVEGLVPEEHMATFAGLTEKRDALEKSKEGKAKALTVPIDNQIKEIDDRLSKMQETGKIVEVDDLTGNPIEETKPHEELKKTEREGIVVPKDYGTAEVIESGEGENKTFKPKATYIEKEGALEVSKPIKIEDEGKVYKDKEAAQKAADEALGKHYYENGLPEHEKPISKSIPLQKEVESKDITLPTKTEEPIPSTEQVKVFRGGEAGVSFSPSDRGYFSDEGWYSITPDKKTAKKYGSKIVEGVLPEGFKLKEALDNNGELKYVLNADEIKQAEKDGFDGIKFLNKDDEVEIVSFNKKPIVTPSTVKSGEINTEEVLKELGDRKVPEGKGNWREAFNKETDPFKKKDILRAIADISTDAKEQADIIEAAKGMPDENNIVHAVEMKQKSKNETTPTEVSKPTEDKYEGDYLTDKNDKKLTVYHGAKGGEVVTDFNLEEGGKHRVGWQHELGIHFGTKENERALKNTGGKEPEPYNIKFNRELDLGNDADKFFPLTKPNALGFIDILPEDVKRWLPDNKEDMRKLLRSDDFVQSIKDAIKKEGYDLVSYNNHTEDNGRKNYIALDPKQIEYAGENTKNPIKAEAEKPTTEKVSETIGTAEERTGTPKDKYEEINNIKASKVRNKEKAKFVDDHFESIVSQLMLKNKIKRIC